jgi:3-oxoacyl-[acyl-carrier-protein] synthase-1
MFPEPLIAAPVTGVTDGLAGIERLFALAVPALTEALKGAGVQEPDVPRTALLVAGSQAPDRVAGSRLATVFAPRLAQRVAKASFQMVRYLPAGTAGFLLALHQGIEMLRSEACACCAVGGVDSWLDLETLAWLDNARRLKSASSPDAFVPGEAASFVVLELQSTAARRGKEPYAECGEVALGEEKNTIWTDKPCTAEALTPCLKTALGWLARKELRPDVLLCDLNGESYRSAEWAYAMNKAFRDGQPVPPLVHPADCLGDVGGAVGGILMALAASAMKKGLPPWSAALLWCSSDNGERAACSVLKRG